MRGFAPEAARDEIRRLKSEGIFPAAGVIVELEGTFDFSGGTFVLERQDGGLGPDARVVYRAGKSGATFTGGRRIPGSALKPVDDPDALTRLDPSVRSRVLSCSLREQGLDRLPPLPDVLHAWDGLEVFCGSEARQLARYPNGGWLTFGFDDVVDRGVKADRARGEWLFGCRGGTFRCAENELRLARWKRASDVFAHGFWCNDWASDSLKLGKIDPSARTITTQGCHYLGIGPSSASNKEPRRYFVYNLLEELDAPGEWYVDREKLVLYYYPKDDEPGELSVVWHETPLMEMKDVPYVTIEGISFVHSTGPALRATDCESLTLDGVSVSSVTRTGLEIQGGSNGLFRALHVSRTGGVGFRLTGGDRMKLEHANHRVMECDLSRSGRIVSNAACLHIGGCGIRIDHNYVHDAPYNAVVYRGNDHLIEFNEIAFAMMESGDGGGLYTGRDWTSQGNVVRWNYLHHFGASGADYKRKKGIPLFCEPLRHDDSSGIYLDDCDSGDVCVSNVLYKVGRGFLVGGGRDNLVRDNLIVGCARSAVTLDARGFARLRLGDGTKDGWDMIQKLEAVHYLEEPWRSHYPLMSDYLTNERLMPVRTAVVGNVAIGCGEFTGAGWCKERGYFVKELDFRDNLSFGPRAKKDNDIYPLTDASSKTRCAFYRNENLERLAEMCDDGREVAASELLRMSCPDFPDLPVREIGLVK